MSRLAVAGAGAVAGAVIGSIVPGVGTMFGAQLGYMIGSMAGAAFIPEKLPGSKGPRLEDLTMQTAGYGLPIPIVDTLAKIPGNIIWSQDIIEKAVTRKVKQSGKGAGTVQKQTEYKYFGNFAVGFCNWLRPVQEGHLLRMWLDNTLVYDVTGDSDVSQIEGMQFRFYSGNESQTPDPLIRNVEGVDAPYYKGLCYIVFERLPLDKFGNNRFPNVLVEISGNATNIFPEVPATAPSTVQFASSPRNGAYYALTRPGFCVDSARGRIYEHRYRTTGGSDLLSDHVFRVVDLQTMEGITEHNFSGVFKRILGSQWAANRDDTGFDGGVLHLGVDGYLYFSGGSGLVTSLYKIDPDTWSCVGCYGVPGYDATGLNDNYAQLSGCFEINSFQVLNPMGGKPRTFLMVMGAWSQSRLIDAGTMSFVWGQDSAKDPVPPFTQSFGISPQLIPMRHLVGRTLEDGRKEVWVLQADWDEPSSSIRFAKITVSYSAAGYAGPGSSEPELAFGLQVDTGFDPFQLTVEGGLSSGPRATLCGGYYDEADDTLVITVTSNGGTLTGMFDPITFKIDPEGSVGSRVVWNTGLHDLGGGSPPSTSFYHGISGAWDPGSGPFWGQAGAPLIRRGTGEIVIPRTGGPFTNYYWLDDQIAVLGFTTNNDVNVSKEIVKRYLNRMSGASAQLSSLVLALCVRSGMDQSQVDTSALVDEVRGYTLARPMSGRDAILPLAATYMFYAVEENGVLRFKKRGIAPVATIPYSDVLHPQVDDSPAVQETRAQDQDLPSKVTVKAYDITRGWEQNSQSWDRPRAPTAVMYSLNESVVELAVPLTPDEMRTIAKRNCLLLWRSRSRFLFSLSQKYLYLVPTDSIILTMKDGTQILLNITKTTLGNNWEIEIEAETEDASVFNTTAAGSGGDTWRPAVIPQHYYALLQVPNIPLVQDSDDMAQQGLAEYAFTLPYKEANWRGMSVYRSNDGQEWEFLAGVPNVNPWGALSTDLVAHVDKFTTQVGVFVQVKMSVGSLDSVTSLQMLNGANLCVLIDPSSEAAEFFQFRDAVDLGSGVFELSTFIRGRRGTEDRQVLDWPVGSLFVPLSDEEGRMLYSSLVSERLDTQLLKALDIYQYISDGVTVSKSVRGRAEQPYAPWNVKGVRDGGNNLTITWVRRSRRDGEWKDYAETLPLNEGSELYDLEVVSGPPAPIGAVYSARTGTAANAFDGNTATDWLSTIPTWISISFEDERRLSSYAIQARTSSPGTDSPRDWQLQIPFGAGDPVVSANVGSADNAWDVTTTGEWTGPDATLPYWTSIAFDGPRTVSSYSMRNGTQYASASLASWTLYGSHDGVAWHVVHHVSGETWSSDGQTKTYDLGFAVSYSQYRLEALTVVDPGSTTVFRVRFIALFEGASGTGRLVNENWLTVDTRSAETTWTSLQTRNYTLSTPVTAKTFRLRISANNGGGNQGFSSWRLYAEVTTVVAYDFARAGYEPAIVRLFSDLATPTVVYTAADQTTDFGAVQSRVYASVYQKSLIVGRGIPRSVVL